MDLSLRTVLFALLLAAGAGTAACPSGKDDDDDSGEGEGEGEGEQCEPRTCSGTGEQCCPIDDARTACKNLNSSFTDCGGCGDACDSELASTCSAGECICGDGPACDGGQTSTCCPGQPASCVDLQTDDDNCGGCSSSCVAPTSQAAKSDHCLDGECVCGDVGEACEGTLDSTCCADEGGAASCHDIRSDPAHCGECGKACDPTIGNICRVAQCVCGIPEDIAVDAAPCENPDAPDADSLDSCCPDPEFPDDPDYFTCVDLDANFNHCGECGNGCNEGQECVGGECQDKS
ncbi:MAG: hypothetical protein HYY06_18770 [Deltaproteobacteria bacterium]|nr:hypothetical protein [Deltaproteobacteria bacterium]